MGKSRNVSFAFFFLIPPWNVLPSHAFKLNVHQTSLMDLYHSSNLMMNSGEDDNVDDQGREDTFDRLPDALLHLILEKVRDARSLSRCLCVSKRFASIVPQIDSVSLAIVRRNRNPDKKAAAAADGAGGTGKYFKRLLQRTVARPVQFLLRILNKKSTRGGDDFDFEYCSPQEGLRNFSEIRSLEIELPRNGGEIGSGNDGYPLLKWRAEFGSELEGCVILGAKSFNKSLREFKSGEDKEGEPSPTQTQTQSQTDIPLADEDLKLRVVWTISCLIAASARHHLLQQVVSDHQKLRSVVVSDAIRQGKLSMKEKQIEEMRRSIPNPDLSDQAAERSRIPALKMKLWYVPELELPLSGGIMEGATLVVIRPSDDNGKKVDSDREMVARVLGEAMEDRNLGEAVKVMMKLKRTYTLEMNSF